jgi:hypothetical protein
LDLFLNLGLGNRLFNLNLRILYLLERVLEYLLERVLEQESQQLADVPKPKRAFLLETVRFLTVDLPAKQLLDLPDPSWLPGPGHDSPPSPVVQNRVPNLIKLLLLIFFVHIRHRDFSNLGPTF